MNSAAVWQATVTLLNLSEIDGERYASTTGGAVVVENEREHILKAQRGDKEAFRELISSYKGYVYTLIRRQVGSADVAEDLAQEVFIRVFRGLPSFRLEAKFKTWLTRITLNTTHSYFASRQFSEKKATELLPENSYLLDQLVQPEPPSPNEAHLLLFQEALQQLPPKLREAISLCCIQERQYEEVAALLEIPIGTVRSRLHTARMKLKEVLFSLLKRQAEDEL